MIKTYKNYDISISTNSSFAYRQTKHSLNMWKKFKNTGTHKFFITHTFTITCCKAYQILPTLESACMYLTYA